MQFENDWHVSKKSKIYSDFSKIINYFGKKKTTSHVKPNDAQLRNAMGVSIFLNITRFLP